jgi:hypothetical protein
MDHLQAASKLESQNSLVTKLVGTWNCVDCTMIKSALALCYSIGEYCVPVWAWSAHTIVDVQLNVAMRLVTGTVKPIALPWLSVLSNIEPPIMWLKAAVDKLIT